MIVAALLASQTLFTRAARPPLLMPPSSRRRFHPTFPPKVRKMRTLFDADAQHATLFNIAHLCVAQIAAIVVNPGLDNAGWCNLSRRWRDLGRR